MIGLGGYYVGTTELATIPNLDTSSYSWTVDQPSGSSMIFQVTDANGDVGYIQNIQVGDGDGDDSCVNTSATASTGTASWTASETGSMTDDGSDDVTQTDSSTSACMLFAHIGPIFDSS